MKKYLFIFFMFLLPSFAQNAAAVKLGLFNPSATDGGFIIGYEGWHVVDQRVSIGWSVDWFNKNYVDKQLVHEFDDFFGIPNSELNELRAKTNLHDIPIMATVTGGFPIAQRTKLYFTGAVGLDALLIFYNNYENPDEDEFHAAFNFAWRIGGGIWYEFSRRSDVFAELTYHNSKPSWTFEVQNQNRKRTFERTFNMNGFMARVGMRFYF